MNENEFDRAARAWLEDGPTQMSDHAVLSALEEIHTTRQRRAVWPAWRATPVSTFARVTAITAVLVTAVGLLAVNVVPRQPDGPSVGGQPTPSPSAAQTFLLSPLTEVFVSQRNGLSIWYSKYGDGRPNTPATASWDPGKEDPGDAFDVVRTGYGPVFRVASTEIPDGVSVDEWADTVVVRHTSNSCLEVPRSQQAEIAIDGQPGRISDWCPDESNEIVATVVAGGRLYQISLLHCCFDDARGFFDYFAARIRLTPETAYFFPRLTTTFVSPTNGFAVKYLDRGEGSLTTAREPWDPVIQPPVDERKHVGTDYPDAFDSNETGYGAVFLGASTEVPDGVSIDEWADTVVVKGSSDGCMVPRSQQAEIIIDGQAGRISECPAEIVATVVAGGRLYEFTLLHSRGDDARAFFDAYAATIDLRPEDAP